MKLLRAASLVLTVMVSPGLMGQTARVNWLVSAPFKDYKTYAWKEPSTQGTDFFSQFVKPDVDAQLAAKGLQKPAPGQKPDLFVVYRVQTQEEPNSKTTQDGFAKGEDTWGLSDCWDGCGWGDDGTPSTTTRTPRMMAILTVDLADVKTNKLVWRGQATVDSVSKTEKGDKKQVETAVERMFKKYPPK